MSDPSTPAQPRPFSLPPPPVQDEAWEASVPPPRRSGRALLLAGILALALVVGGATWAFVGSREPDASGPPTKLALAFDRGDETTYDIHLTMDGKIEGGQVSQPLTMNVSESVGWRVVRVASDGTATVRLAVKGLSGSVNGMPVPPDQSQRSTTLRVTPTGQIVDANGLSFGSTGASGLGGFPGMDQVTPILPDHAVAPGDSWDKTYSQSMPFGDGKIQYTAHSTFERYEDVGAVRAAVVTTEYTVPLDFSLDLGDLARALGGRGDVPVSGGNDVRITYGGQGSFTQTSWLDLKARTLVKTSSAGEFDMQITFPGLEAQLGTDGLSMSARFTLDMTRR